MKKFFCLILSVISAVVLVSSCGKEGRDQVIDQNSDNSSVSGFSDDESSNVQNNNDDVISFVGVGDNLIHTTIYEEADKYAGEINDGCYDFTPMYSEVKSLIQGTILLL